ncbi:hypothetical protein VN96_1831 [Lactococcus cremoris]|nr:hypothetical protein VN96_1831 [Lactococcus cremoris]
MAKNDYIEKITQNLEHLTKDELKDVSILTTAQLGVRLKVAEKEYWEKEVEAIKSQLQQQSLPVVPECVGIAIESLPDDYSAFEAISLINAKIHALPEENKDWLPVYNWLREDVKNQDIFALAFITGKYEVEKPQLFYLKNKLTGDCLAICLARASSGLYVEVTEKWLTRKEQTSYKLYFTQQEIDSMETGSYELVPVEDGE